MQLAELAFALAAKGHDVTVLTARRGYTPPNPLLPAEEKINGVRVIRTWPYHFRKENRMLRMAEALLVNLAFAVKIMALGRFDRILAMTSPPFVAWFSALYAAIRKIPFFLDMAYERIVNHFEFLKGLRVNILGRLIK